MPIDRDDIERLKEIFVTRQECDSDMEGVSHRLSKNDTRLAVIESKLSLILWLLAAVCGGIITMLVKILFGG